MSNTKHGYRKIGKRPKDAELRNTSIRVADSRKGSTSQREFDILYFIIVGIILSILAFILDKSILGMMRAIYDKTLASIFIVITSLGEQAIYAALIIIFAIFLLVYRKRIIPLALGVISILIIEEVLKNIIMRPRPFEYLHVASLVPTSSYSFPSGHALAFFLLVPFFIVYFPRLKVYSWIVAGLVAFSRIYLQVHYLSDVLAGGVIGFVVGYLLIHYSETHDWRLKIFGFTIR